MTSHWAVAAIKSIQNQRFLTQLLICTAWLATIIRRLDSINLNNQSERAANKATHQNIMMSSNNDNDNNPSELSTPPPTNPNDDNALRTSTGSSEIQSSSVGGSGLGSALNSPLLNGEHIVLLSLSNDNTPRNNGAVERRRSGFDVIERQDNTNLLSS